MGDTSMFGTNCINTASERIFITHDGKTYVVDALDQMKDSVIKKEANRLGVVAANRRECIAKIRMKVVGIELQKKSYCKIFIIMLLLMFCALVALPLVGYILLR